jgi:hypothetical protein
VGEGEGKERKKQSRVLFGVKEKRPFLSPLGGVLCVRGKMRVEESSQPILESLVPVDLVSGT